MKKSILFIAANLFIAAIVVFGFMARPAFADNSVSVTNQKVAYDFPKSMTFTADVANASNITKITLVVRFPTVTRRVPVEFTPGANVHIRLDWNLDSENSTADGGYLPPGVTATYTWLLEDAAGTKTETDPQTFTVQDNRIAWQTVEDDALSINWYGAGKSFGQSIFDAGKKTSAMVRQQLGAATGGKVYIWFYTNDEDFQTSMPGMNVWTGGRSFGEYRVIILHTSAQDLQDAIQGAQHELTHQVVYDGLGSGLAREAFPPWLNEGLATYNEFDGGTMAPFLNDPYQQAIKNDTLPTLRSRDGAFPPDPHEALLSYGISFGVVDFLFKQFGNAKMTEMFSEFKQGNSADQIFVKVFGVNTDGIDNLFRKSVGLPERDLSKAGFFTPEAAPTFALSSAETSVPSSGATATPRAVSIANTPAPAAATAVTSSGNSSNSGGASSGICGGVLGGFALAMVGAYEWRKRRGPNRL